MKKLLSITVALIVMSVLILSGCGTSSKSGSNGSSNTSSGTNQTAKAPTKTLKVVTDASYAPFENMDKGKIVGFDVDLLNAVAKVAGYKVDIQNVGWDAVFASLQGKDADLGISAITINSDRKQTYDFSIPYFASTNEIMVKKDSTISGGKDLKGKTVAVQNGTTGQAVVEGILGKNSNKIKKFENNNLAIMELINGGADAVVADSGVVDSYVKNNPGQNLKVVEDNSFPKEFYGLMFPKGSQLVPDFNKGIQKVVDNGTYTQIFNKWFGKDPNLDVIKSAEKDALNQ